MKAPGGFCLSSLILILNIYIISHKFPPFSGVGAQRWTHLAAALAELGHNVSVVTVPRGGKPDVPHDVLFVQSDSFYRLVSKKFSSRLVNGIYHRLVDLVRKFVWFDDEAQFWGRYVVPKIIQDYDEGKLDVLIATGHPFQSNRIAAQIKQQRPCLTVVQDYRDPWSLNPFKKYLFSSQKRKVVEWERESMLFSDANVFVTQGLAELMGQGDKTFVIENGHPFPDKLLIEEKEDYWVHTGTLANGRDLVAEPFFQLCSENSTVLKGAKVYFYGRISLWLRSKYSHLFDDGLFIEKGLVPQKELKDVIARARVGLQFNADQYFYLVSTKLYEYPALGTPVLSINNGGEINNLITDNRIGVCSSSDKVEMLGAIERILEFSSPESLAAFCKSASFSKRAQQYESLLLKLVKF